MTIALLSSKTDIIKRISSILDIKAIITEKEIKSSDFDIVILDTNSFDDPASIIKEQHDIPVIALSAKPDYEEGGIFLKAGAKGYGNVFMSKENIIHAVAAVKEGNLWLYPEFIQKLIKNSIVSNESSENPKLELLSKKEREVAKLVSKGLGNKEIAQNMQITEITVKTHLRSIYQKTGTKNRLSLALLFR